MRFALTWTDATLRRVRDVTPSIRVFEIVPAGGRALPYSVGSHINVSVLVGGQPDTRSYSLVGEGSGESYRIAVKRQPESRGGSSYMWGLKEGAKLSVTEPHALFTLEYDRPEYLLVAGGIGITPIVGMALQLARRHAPVRMLYAARTRDDLAFLDELAPVLGERLELYVSAEGRRIDLASEFGRLPPGAMAAICGPLPMIDAARRAWAEAGRPSPDLRFETFGSSGSRPPEPFRVRLAGQDREILVPETRTMLAALEDAGIEVISDCLRGECGLCALDIVAIDGEVDHRDVFFSDEQRAENGKICTCVSRAVGTITVDVLYRPD